MHAHVILQHYLAPLLTHIHRRRLATLLDAVASCVSKPPGSEQATGVKSCNQTVGQPPMLSCEMSYCKS